MHSTTNTRAVSRLALSLIASVVALACLASTAVAAQEWRLDSVSRTAAAPGDVLDYRIEATNTGDLAMDGSPITIAVDLPAGLSVADPAGPVSDFTNPHFSILNYVVYTGLIGVISDCTPAGGGALAGGETQVECTTSEPLGTWRDTTGLSTLTVLLPVEVSPSATPGSVLTTEVSVSGGGAGDDLTVDPVSIANGPAPFGFDAFDGGVFDQAGEAYTQAGGVPYSASTDIDFNTAFNPTVDSGKGSAGMVWPAEPVRDVVVDLPAGFVGNPSSLGECTAAELANSELIGAMPQCPADSQVGTTLVRNDPYAHLNFASSETAVGPLPVYNMQTPPGVAARFGFQALGTVVVLDAHVRSGGDYGLSVAARNISTALPITGTNVEFWGVPADPSHDHERHCPGGSTIPDGGVNALDPTCVNANGDPGYDRPELTALLRNPTSCVGPVDTTAYMDSWTDPGAQTAGRRPDLSDSAWESSSFTSHEPVGYPYPPSDWGSETGATGCGQVPFTPDIDVEPTSDRADSPTGLEVDLTVPQDALSDPEAVAQADLRNAVVTLPKGMSVNPSSADGLGACSSAQIKLNSDVDAACPDSSKIGTVSVDTPLLGENTPGEEDLKGSVYLASQGDNPFNSIMALYLVAKDPKTGVVVKLAGKVEGDANGTLTTTFVNQPQLPFSSLHLELKDGPRAPLVNPGCGTHTAKSSLTGWAGNASAVVNSSFQVSQGPNGGACPSGFAPGFDAGLTSQIASSSSPFVLKLSRRDGEQQLSSLSVRMPKGLAGKLAGVPFCAESLIPSGNCSAASKVGIVQAGAGSGPNTFYVPQGSVYLAGPYKGAPLSLVTSVPAVAGPFNLGNVVVRSQLQVDRRSAQVTVVADPLPQAVKGVALHLRDLYVAIDRDGFMSAPTSCDKSSVDATIGGAGGAVSRQSEPFQMLLCRSLGFDPKLSLRLTGKKQLRSKGHPGIRATVTQTEGEAAIEKAEVRLPSALVLDVDNADALCEFKDGTKPDLENHCPKGSVVGTATAVSPLLNKPLSGKVFFVKNVRRDPDTGREIRTLPMIVAALRGEIAVNLVGESAVRGGRLVSTFNGVPDAPVSRFSLNITGGKSGILLITKKRNGNTIDLCRAGRQTAVSQMDGHNGKPADDTITVSKPKCAKRKRVPKLRLGANAKHRQVATRGR